MSTATKTHPYPFDADGFDTGVRHGESRYSLTASTGPAWVYWYHEGRYSVVGPAGRR
jgi:hypothetical protein